MRKYKYMLFDLDGTLIDTNYLILESFRSTFQCHLNEIKTDEELVRFFGIPLRKPFEELCPGIEDMMIETFRGFNETNHDQCVGLFIGITHVLEKLKENNITLGVVTSKSRDLALRGMKLFGLDKLMSVFIALEDTKTHKPNGEPILKALERLGIKEKESVLYVGDSSYDILCAKNAGVGSAAVGWSCIPKDELLKCEPDLYIEKPANLLNYI